MKSTFKPALLACLYCLISSISIAQYAKFVVVFTNKNNSPYSISQPIKYLSQKAIDRRTRYNIKIDSADLPVNPFYISQVIAQGTIMYLSQSKWLNQILIVIPDTSVIKKITKLTFVQSVKPVAPLTTQVLVTSNQQNKFNETIQPVTNIALNTTTTNVLNYGSSYQQIHIHNGEFLHNKGFTGKGITIAVIDAGFNSYKTIHAFDSARAHNRFLGEKDFVDFDNSVNEDDAHGEECLSVITANVPGKMIGTAPDASFWLLRSENAHSEYPVEEHNWAAAAEFADSAGADMISSSLGYTQFDDSIFDHTYKDFYKKTTMISRAAIAASRKGIIVTNSAGNEGNNSWKYLVFPADDDSICSVAATDTGGTVAWFTSYGYPGKKKPNVASVGLGTTFYSLAGVMTGSGTSFSNPNINGLIACLWQAFPQFNNITILKAVYKSCPRYNGPDNRLGYGLPDMIKAYDTLKLEQNKLLFGGRWLMPTPVPVKPISFKFIGQVNGYVTLSLIDDNNKVVAVKKIVTEYQEVYDMNFDITNPGKCKYTVQYNDGKTIQSFTIDNSIPVSYKNLFEQKAVAMQQ